MNMNTNLKRFSQQFLAGFAFACCALFAARANAKPAPKPAPPVLRGEVYFLERIALLPGARLHVALVGRVAGAEYLPLATQVLPARNGVTRFALRLPAKSLRPAPPYRVQAMIVADNRLFMQGHAPQTLIADLSKPVKIRLKIVPAPQNIDGIGDRTIIYDATVMPSTTLRGTISKLDRRALLPDARVKVMLLDVSRADAPARELASDSFTGRQLPIAWTLTVDTATLGAPGRYVLRAQIYENGKLSYTTEAAHSVTPANAQIAHELRVKSAR